MLTILQIETFLTFDFDPSLTSGLITDSDLDQLKDELAEKKNKKMIQLRKMKKKQKKKNTYCMCFFVVGYIKGGKY